MIVITRLIERQRYVLPGDLFNLTITDGMNCEVVISEEITTSKVIDFIASFRFALEDGTCPGFHLMGVFACKNELPKELQEAVLFENLTRKQQENFAKSVGVLVGKEAEYDELESAERELINKTHKKDFFGFLTRRKK